MRASREIMGDLALSGMTPEQIALVMELTAAVSAEARPIVDEAAQRRRERDKEYQAEKRAARRQNRQISADVADPSLSPAPLPSPQTPQPTPHPHTHPDNKPARVKAPAKPDDVSPQVWADFQRQRNKKRADLSQTALDGIRREAVRAGWTMEAALAECVTRGWQSFKAEWVAETRAAAPANDFLAHLTAKRQREMARGGP